MELKFLIELTIEPYKQVFLQREMVGSFSLKSTHIRIGKDY